MFVTHCDKAIEQFYALISLLDVFIFFLKALESFLDQCQKANCTIYFSFLVDIFLFAKGYSLIAKEQFNILFSVVERFMKAFLLITERLIERFNLPFFLVFFC